MENIIYITLSGSGAVVRKAPLVEEVVEEVVAEMPRQAFIGPRLPARQSRDGLRLYLLRKYNNKYFDYLYDYYRFIFNYKSIFYIDILNELKLQFVKNNKIKIIKPKVKRRYLSNRYEVLEDKEVDVPPLLDIKYKNKISFKCKDYINNKYYKNKRERNYKKLVKLACSNIINMQSISQTRDKILLSKIRQIIIDLKYKRSSKLIVYNRHKLKYVKKFKLIRKQPMYIHAVPESDTLGVHGDGEVGIEKESNTVLTSQRESSTIQTAASSSRWSEWTSNDVVDDYATVTNRWYPIKEFTWSKDDAFDKELFRLELPYSLLQYAHQTQGDVCNVPNTMPFKVHTYWRGDIEIKIQINSNRFQVGQLMAAFYYADSNNKRINSKRSVYGFSQMEHILISANASNEATLYIPYKHIYPFLPIRSVPDWENHQLKMGQLSLHVLAPLRMSTYGPSSASGTVFMRLINSEFTGTNSGTLAESIKAVPEMEKILNVAEGLLNLPRIANCDNPPLTQAPAYLVPTGAHSLSLGTNLTEPLHSLRLDARGQTQHPINCNSDEPLTVQSITSRFGLIDKFEWEKDHAKGVKLYKVEADPFIHKWTHNGNWFTPTGVISSNFMYWRGSLEFKFDFIASQYHTGRVIVGYIPGAEKSGITYEILKSSPFAVFDLQDNNSFTFTVPYVAYRPWWPRRYTGNYVDAACVAPSVLYVFVQIPLTPMESVSSTVDVLVYMRGSSNYEVSIPVQPCLGLNWNTEFVKRDTEKYQVLNHYYPYYAGVWHSFNSSNSLVFRWGAVSDQMAQFPTPKVKTGQYVYFKIADSKEAAIGTQRWEYMVVWPSGHGYNIGIPMQSKSHAQFVSNALYKGGSLLDQAIIQYFTPASMQGPGSYCTGNPYWNASVHSIKGSSNDVREWTVVHPEGELDQSSSLLNPTRTLAISGFGQTFFGENFNDLKNLMRRYQLYGQVALDVNQDKDMDHCAFTFPCLPQGLWLDVGDGNNPKEIYNRCRDGIIPIISSGYRFYRGGLRFKLIFPSGIDANVWIQHRPDRRLKNHLNAKIEMCGRAVSGQGVFNHGYASYIQIGKINNVIEFEVPFYNATCYNLLQSYDSEDTCDQYGVSLGEIAVGFHAVIDDILKIQHKPISIFYSIADDMAFSQWVGYQPMVILDELPAGVSAVPEMQSCKEAVPQGVGDKIKSYFTPTVDEAITKGTESFNKVVTEKINDVTERIKETVATCADAFAGSKNYKNLLWTALSNFIHCLISPNPLTIAWALASFLGHIGIIMHHEISKMYHMIKALLHQEEDQASVSAVPESNVEQEPKKTAALVSIIYAGISSLMGVVIRKPKSMKSWNELLIKDIQGSCRAANVIYTFINNTFEVISSIIDYITGNFSGEARILRQLTTQPQVIKSWVKEVYYLEEPSKRMRRAHDQAYVERVFAAQAFGQIIMTDLMESTEAKPFSILSKTYDKITLLKQEMIEIGSNPYIRKEPFTICVTGPPGVGKSFATDTICAHLLKAAKVPVKSGIKCIVNPLSDYWDQCDHQPVLCVDDMWSVETGPSLEKQLNLLFQVHSPIVLSPPMASLEQKKMRYNPEIFYYNTNKPFPRFDKVDPQAVYRRRHVLIRCKLSDTKKSGCTHCTGETTLDETPASMLLDQHHLVFQKAFDVVDPETKWSDYLSYEEFIEVLTQDFLANRSKNNRVFLQRCKEMEKMRNDEPLDGDSIIETFANHQIDAELKYGEVIKSTITNDLSRMVDDVKLKFVNFRKKIKIPWMKATPEGEFEECIIEEMKDSGFIKDEATAEAVREELLNPSGPSKLPETIEAALDNLKKDIPQLREYVDAGLCNEEYRKEVIEWCTKRDDDCELVNEIFYEVKDALQWVRTITKTDVKLVGTGVQCFKSIQRAMYRYANHVQNKDLISSCDHWALKLEDTFCSSGQLFYIYPKINKRKNHTTIDNEKHSVGVTCGSEKCILTSKYFRYMFYKTWLHSHPIHRLAYDQKKFNSLPLYFVMNQDLIEIDSTFSQMVIFLKDWYSRHVHPILLSIVNFIKKYWPMLMLILPIAATTVMTVETVRMAHSDSQTWNAYPQSKNYNISEPVARQSSIPMVKPQSSQQGELIPEIIRTNMVNITAMIPKINNAKNIVMRGLMLRNRQMLILRHYVEQAQNFEKGTTFYWSYAFEHNRRVNQVNGIPIDFLNLPKQQYGGKVENSSFDSNFVLINLSHDIPESKSVIKFIARQKDHKSKINSGVLCNEKAHQIVTVTLSNSIPHIISEKGTSDVIMKSAYTYPYHGRGVCGSILIDPNAQHPIIGMHVAGVEGVDGYGLAEPLMFEMFETLPQPKNETYTDIAEPKLLPRELSTIEIDSIIYPYGCVPKQLSQPQMQETRIEGTFFRGLYEIRTQPAPLSSRDSRIAPICPLQAGVEKHGRPPKHFQSNLLCKAKTHLSEKINSVVQPLQDVNVLSESVAILGLPGVDGYDPLTWNTSAGFPLSHVSPVGVSGKRWLFDMEETSSGYHINGMHTELRRLLDVNYTLRECGIKPTTVFVDCLKDATLPLKKCNTPGGTRIFSISPVQYTIQFRQYYLDFMAAYRRARFTAEHGIGMDVQSNEWTKLAFHLSANNKKKFITGDYSNFGPALDSEVARAAFDIIIDWIMLNTTNQNKENVYKHLNILAEEILCPFHQVGNLIYRVPCGIPSGSPITDILNSIANCLYVRIAWLDITSTDLYEFDKNVVLVVYGDDLIASVSDEYSEVFNTVSMAAFFEKHDIKFTDADKSGKLIPYRTLGESSFLKRTFVPHPIRPSLFMAKLDQVSVEGVLNWYHKGSALNKIEASKINALQALELAHGSGKEYFDDMRGRIRKRALACGIKISLPDWNQLDNRMYED